jgi:hypothetical protein
MRKFIVSRRGRETLSLGQISLKPLRQKNWERGVAFNLILHL